jgi:hypothetical protein
VKSSDISTLQTGNNKNEKIEYVSINVGLVDGNSNNRPLLGDLGRYISPCFELRRWSIALLQLNTNRTRRSRL